jgi:hypothetical protein
MSVSGLGRLLLLELHWPKVDVSAGASARPGGGRKRPGGGGGEEARGAAEQEHGVSPDWDENGKGGTTGKTGMALLRELLLLLTLGVCFDCTGF